MTSNLEDSAWAHIEAERFAEAEVLLRQAIAQSDEAHELWHLFAMLAGVLNELGRPADGTAAYRQALAEARSMGPDRLEVGACRYMLANQCLIYGDPAEALAEALPVSKGGGHVQCLLHAVAAHALWKQGQRSEAQSAARRALDACPTEARTTEIGEQLAYVLEAQH